VAAAQFLLFMGTCFSLAALGDCSFVSVSPGIMVTEGNDENSLVKRLGFITFGRPDGTCYWYEDGDNADDQIRDYWDFLGGDWTAARILGGVSAASGMLFFLFSISMCCSSHFLGVRLFMAFLVWVVLALFQCMTFMVFSSDICTENECKFSRSAGWSVAAAACFCLSGFCHVIMRDYPGPIKVTPPPPRETKAVPAIQEQAPVDEEAVPVEENNDEEAIENKEAVESEEGIENKEEIAGNNEETPVEVAEKEVIVDEGDPELAPTSEEPQALAAVEEVEPTEPAVQKSEVEEVTKKEGARSREAETTQTEVATPEDEEVTNAPAGPSEADIPGGGEWSGDSTAPKQAEP